MPEMWSVGFAGSELHREADHLNERLVFLAEMARTHHLWIAAGSLPEVASGKKVFNTLFLFDPAGTIRFSYRKIHLFPNSSEPKYFQSGYALPEPVKTGKWVIGAGICYDLRMPELFRVQARQGVNLFLVPTQFPDPRLDHFHLFCRARAIENLAWLAGINRIGFDGTLSYSGGSAVFGPFGEVIATAEKAEEVVIGEIDAGEIQRVRREYPFLKETLVLDSLVANQPLTPPLDLR